MNEQERQELIERRKKELSEKELESDLHRDLSLQEQKNKQREIRYKYESEYVEIAIIFFGTLIPLYLFLFGVKFVFIAFFGAVFRLMGISLAWLNPVLHIFIWISAGVSAYRKRSILDSIANKFF